MKSCAKISDAASMEEIEQLLMDFQTATFPIAQIRVFGPGKGSPRATNIVLVLVVLVLVLLVVIRFFNSLKFRPYATDRN